jgi:RNA polymerase sigma-70 factor (ECF subfamily)
MGVIAPVRPHPVHEVEAEDATLVAQALGGNERAFAQLYRRHARYSAGIVYRLMGSDAELEDVIQEGFVEASRALASLDDPAQFRSWLARIIVRRVHKRLARRRRFRWLLGSISDVTPKVSDPRDRESIDSLYEVLEQVTPKLRIPWTLHVIEGQTLPDVATLCKTSLATVKRRIAEAGTLIERRLHGRG